MKLILVYLQLYKLHLLNAFAILIFEQLKIEQNQMNDIAVPCVVRITSEVSGSDGSSSMATVCGATACLQDAGVPITAPVAGVSIGLMTPSKGKYYKATQ